MFTASGTSCQNDFICPERGVTLPSAKHNYLYVHTLPGRTKRHTLGSARVGRDPLSGPGSVCAVPCGAPVCQARPQSDAEVGQACPRPPQPLGTLQAQSGGPHPRRRVICLLRDQQAQVTPCPPTKPTARGADPWAIARTHTPVKDADLPCQIILRGHQGAREDTAFECAWTGLSRFSRLIQTASCVTKTAQTGAEEAQLCSRSRKGPHSVGHVPGPPMPGPRQGTCLSHGLVWAHTSGAGVCVEMAIRPQMDRQTSSRQTVLSSARGPGRACD